MYGWRGVRSRHRHEAVEASVEPSQTEWAEQPASLLIFNVTARVRRRAVALRRPRRLRAGVACGVIVVVCGIARRRRARVIRRACVLVCVCRCRCIERL